MSFIAVESKIQNTASISENIHLYYVWLYESSINKTIKVSWNKSIPLK